MMECERFGHADNDDIWESVIEFFDTLYIIFPIVSYGDLACRLTAGRLEFCARSSHPTLAIRLLNA